VKLPGVKLKMCNKNYQYVNLATSRTIILFKSTEYETLVHLITTNLYRPHYRSIANASEITVEYLCKNCTQVSLARGWGTNPSSISGTISAILVALDDVLLDSPAVEDLAPARHYVLDGMLLCCGSCRKNTTLYAGQHSVTGDINVQVLVNHDGRILYLSDSTVGAMHYKHATSEAGIFDHLTVENMTSRSRMYQHEARNVGQMLRNLRKLAKVYLQCNRALVRIRHIVERAIGNMNAA